MNVYILVCTYLDTYGRSQTDLICFSTFEKAKDELLYRLNFERESGYSVFYEPDEDELYATVNRGNGKYAVMGASYEIVRKKIN